MKELSLNQVESLAAKAARGGGFSWGLAEDIGCAARGLAIEGVNWAEPLLALLAQAGAFEPPGARRIARWRLGQPDEPSEAPLCPVRTAALLNDAPANVGEGVLRLFNVGRPVWLYALVNAQGVWRVETDLGADAADATLQLGGEVASAVARRARAADEILDALNAYAARTYVPESHRSRTRGAGGGRVDDE